MARENTEQLSQQELLELSAELRRIRIFSRRFAESEQGGSYRSKFKGSGLVFSDLREYQPGDDVKHIHWKVTARTKRPFVKTYEEERQLSVVIALDESYSMSAGVWSSRNRRLRLFSGLVATLARFNNDLLGFCAFGSTLHHYLKPAGSRAHHQRIWKLLLESRPYQESTNLEECLTFLSQNLKKRSVVFLCSDFVSPPFEDSLRRLSYTHDVVCVYLKEAWEDALPTGGMVSFRDPESGKERVIDTSSRRVRAALQAQEEHMAKELSALCLKTGAEALIVSEQISSDFRSFLRLRKRGRR